MPSPEELESQMHRLLRSLPDRRAPAGLESRVMAEIARRAALPWWKRSYPAWPAPARLLFFTGSALAAAVLIVALGRLAWPARQWAANWQSFFSDLAGAAGSVLGHIPTLWMYVAGAALLVSYGLIVGIGSALYRTLIPRPSHSP